MSKYRTVMYVADAGVSIPLEISYEYRNAYLSPGRESPDEPAHCEVTAVVADVPVPLIGFVNVDWLVDELNADDEFQAALMEDHAGAEDDAAEMRARRDDHL